MYIYICKYGSLPFDDPRNTAFHPRFQLWLVITDNKITTYTIDQIGYDKKETALTWNIMALLLQVDMISWVGLRLAQSAV